MSFWTNPKLNHFHFNSILLATKKHIFSLWILKLILFCIADYSVMEVMREEPARVTIRGLRRSFYPPTHLPLVNNSPPDKKLQLEWVYGYRGTDTRKNLWVLPSGELLYYVAAVAVLFDREENTQRHYIGHTEDITCMEVKFHYISINLNKYKYKK